MTGVCFLFIHRSLGPCSAQRATGYCRAFEAFSRILDSIRRHTLGLMRQE